MSAVFDLTGRTALITGSVRGIGFALAEGLCNAGATVIVNGRKQDAVEEAVAKLQAKGFQARGAVFDVAEELAVVAAFENFDRDGVEIDILINNAGIQFRKPMVELELKDWERVIDTNLNAAFLVGREAAKRMIARGRGGKIINIASLLSFQGGIRVPSYTAAKSGVLGLTRLMANEWAAKGINVNAIAPGYIETNNTEALRQDAGRAREILQRIPAGRWGAPQDLGGAAVFLASSAADYVHGHTLAVDGGWLAR